MNVLKYANKLVQIVLSHYWRECESLNWTFDPKWFQNRRQMISEKFQRENIVGREKLVLIKCIMSFHVMCNDRTVLILILLVILFITCNPCNCI
jgi:hypothetical protein